MFSGHTSDKTNRRDFKCLMPLILALLLLSGCATYKAVPLTEKAVEDSLAAPADAELRIRAATLTHPILQPLTLDISDGLSPDEAAVLAVILNPGLRAARDRRGIAGAETIRAGILPNPRLSYSFEIPIGGTTPDTVNAYGAGIGWDIKALITRQARLSAARANNVKVGLEVAWQEWQVAMRARLTLYRLIIANKKAALEARRAKILKKRFALTEKGVRLGVKTSEDLSSARSALDDGRAALIKARRDEEAKRLALNRLMGLAPDVQIRPEKNYNMAPFSNIPSIGTLTEGMENRRLDIRALRLGYKSEEARLRGAVLAQFPSINIGAAAAKDTDGVKTTGGIFGIDIPIFNRNQGAIAVERATRKKLFDEYTARIFEARAGVARLHNNLISIKKRLAKMEKSTREMEIHLGAYKQSVEDGVFNALDYHDLRLRLEQRRLHGLWLKEQEVEEAIALEMASGQYIFRDTSAGREKIKKSTEAEVLR